MGLSGKKVLGLDQIQKLISAKWYVEEGTPPKKNIFKKSRKAEIWQLRFFIYQNPCLGMAKSLSQAVTKYCVEVCWAVTKSQVGVGWPVTKYQVEVGLSVTKYWVGVSWAVTKHQIGVGWAVTKYQVGSMCGVVSKGFLGLVIRFRIQNLTKIR